MDPGCCRREGSRGLREGQEKSTQGNAQRECFPHPLAWKARGAKFRGFLQPNGLQARSLSVSGLDSESLEASGNIEASVVLLEKQTHNPGDRQCRNSSLRNAWGTQ